MAEPVDNDPFNDTGETDTDSPVRSLYDDVQGLFADGKTYVDAEMAYQKQRLGFAAQRGKAIAIYGGLAAFLILLAVFALVFGAIMALAPALTAAGATLAVTLCLLVAAAISALVAHSNLRRIKAAFAQEERGTDDAA